MGAISLCSSIRRLRTGFPVAAGHHPNLEQAAFKWPVEQRCLAAGLQADQLGETQVSGEEKAVPAGPMALERRTELRIEGSQLILLAEREERAALRVVEPDPQSVLHASPPRRATPGSDAAGGASGALYGSAITAFGQGLDANGTDARGFHEALESALDAVKRLGGAEVGDKTMVDTLEPFVVAYGEAADGGAARAGRPARGSGVEGASAPRCGAAQPATASADSATSAAPRSARNP